MNLRIARIFYCSFFFVLAVSSLSMAKDYKITVGPYLQNVKQNEITVMWETDKPGPSLVVYGESKNDLKKIESDELVKIHEIVLKDLKPATKYIYRAITEDSSSTGEFRTAPVKGTPFRFAVWGDNRTNFFKHTEVAKAIAKANPDIAINVGDVVTDGTKYDQWEREYFKPIKSFSKTVPTFIAVGNHERNSEWYYKYVSQPGNEAWFSFDYSDAHFVIVDSNQDYSVGSEQYKWLEGDLASDVAQEAKWLFVFKHHPEWSEGWDKPGYSGEPEMVKVLVPLWEKYDVDIVFAGHTHDYERGELNGVKYIISGGGGASLDSFMQDIEHYTVYESAYQYCTIDIDGNNLKFESVTPEGKVLDSFEISM